MTTETAPTKQIDEKELERVTIRFAGDSGDGMQLTGTQFTRTAAVFGNDISTLPDYPAEIRAPAGSLPGVSGFQISFSSAEIYNPETGTWAPTDSLTAGRGGFTATLLPFGAVLVTGGWGVDRALTLWDTRSWQALLSLRMHGQGSDRYEHVRIGYNSRLDTMPERLSWDMSLPVPDVAVPGKTPIV